MQILLRLLGGLGAKLGRKAGSGLARGMDYSGWFVPATVLLASCCEDHGLGID